jgi:hypothetical protein
VTSAVATELKEQLLTQEELDSREGAITAWEDGLAASECALRRACMERDAEHFQDAHFYFQVQTLHQLQPDARGAPDPPFPVGDGPGDVGGEDGRGAGTWSTFL